MSEVLPSVSLRRVCRALDVNRSSVYLTQGNASVEPRKARLDENLADRLHALVKQHPTFGYRRLWALLRFGQNVRVNLKKVHRIVQLRRWQVKERLVAPRPRVQQKVSRAERSNERWAMDVTHVYCGKDGWGHLAAVIDCHDREVVGFEFALRGRAKEAERALEEACLSRFGTLRPTGDTPMLRSGNGLIFTSKRFREACKFYLTFPVFGGQPVKQRWMIVVRAARTRRDSNTPATSDDAAGYTRPQRTRKPLGGPAAAWRTGTDSLTPA